jgi:hypothetical protein
MLHLGNQILEYRIGNVANEEIARVVLGGKELFSRIRVLVPSFAVRGFRYGGRKIRGFR